MSGIGRGRGWLNINKNLNTKPGMQSPTVTESPNNIDFSTSNTSPKPTGKYANIINKIALYNENDDGILLNQKLKHIIEEFNECASAKEVNESFNAIYEHCLADEEFATKAIGVASAQSFNKVVVHNIRLRNLFISQFQNDFESRKQLQANNPAHFRIIVKMLSDFYFKARLFDGQPYKFLASPVLKYLDMMLEICTEQSLQLFTTMLHMNGNSIRGDSPLKLMSLLIQVRNILAYNDKLSSVSKLWLMMAIDISNFRFNFMPHDLYAFYLSHLGETAMSQIKNITTDLSIQTNYHNTTLDSIHSTVNVLQQVTSAIENWESPSSTTLDSEKSSIVTNNIAHVNPTRNFNNDAGFSNIGTWEQPKNEKTPRPILGAGVRMNKVPEDSSWGDKKHKQQKKTPEGRNNSKPKKTSKDWGEHDDRFETDYN